MHQMNESLIKSKCLLFLNNLNQNDPTIKNEIELLSKNFAGLVLHDCYDLNDPMIQSDSIVYITGNLRWFKSNIERSLFVYGIKELSTNYDPLVHGFVTFMIELGKVPIDVYGLGILFRKSFSTDDESFMFKRIQNDHKFQNLTESDKPNSAFRTGLYLSDVGECDDDGSLMFRLLRCSSNFTGPTEGFKVTDSFILMKLNLEADLHFENSAKMNHVLAQIYHNSEKSKAKIKSHSDKTKDMPRNGIMAFCTFYDLDNPTLPKLKKSESDPFDLCYKKSSALTTIKFRLKKPINDEPKLPQEFSVKMYPDSVFMIPLSTNRLYTHEICPSILPFDKIPTRMGYVVRCSKTLAMHKDGKTFIKANDEFHPMVEPTESDVEKLRHLYFKENSTDQLMDYGDVFFSLNQGDYMRPIVN